MALAFAGATTGLALLSLMVARRGTPVALGAAVVFVLAGAAWIAREWTRHRRRSHPYELAFRHDGHVAVRLAPGEGPFDCDPDPILCGQRTLAASLRPVAGAPGVRPLHWLSGDDAVGDEDWRRIRAWIVWRRRGGGQSP